MLPTPLKWGLLATGGEAVWVARTPRLPELLYAMGESLPNRACGRQGSPKSTQYATAYIPSLAQAGRIGNENEIAYRL